MKAICDVCGKKKKIKGRGMCQSCYSRERYSARLERTGRKRSRWNRKDFICFRCGRRVPHKAKNMCGACWEDVDRLKKRPPTYRHADALAARLDNCIIAGTLFPQSDHRGLQLTNDANLLQLTRAQQNNFWYKLCHGSRGAFSYAEHCMAVNKIYQDFGMMF